MCVLGAGKDEYCSLLVGTNTYLHIQPCIIYPRKHVHSFIHTPSPSAKTDPPTNTHTHTITKPVFTHHKQATAGPQTLLYPH